MQNIKKLKGNDLGDELFVLATNFLLYIALVILTMLLQKMYFPHTIPDDEDAPETVMADDEDEEKRVEMAPLKGPQGEGEEEKAAPASLSSKGLEVPGLVKSKSLESFAKLIDFQNFDQVLCPPASPPVSLSLSLSRGSRPPRLRSGRAVVERRALSKHSNIGRVWPSLSRSMT